MASIHQLKVGIDFGTTFSGVAWINPLKQDDIIVIRDWPGVVGSFEKVPSKMTYNDNGTVKKWGFQVKPDQEHVSLMKLGLDTSRDGYNTINFPEINRNQNITPGNRLKKRPVDLVTDYLRCLNKHTKQKLERTYGKATVDTTSIKYVVTVPAIWSEVSKKLTLQAAEAAGFGSASDIELMSEPDAAAAWTLLRDLPTNGLNVHDAFVVVDCGGGTVDLISYEVVKISPSFIVKECAEGTGALCGSTHLDQRFENLVRARLGKQRFESMAPESRQRMLREFELVLKRTFPNDSDDDDDYDDDDDDDIFTCPADGLPDDPVAKIKKHNLILTRKDMESIFDPVINQIVPLVQQQISIIQAQNRNISAVLLVGGFGESRYLYQRLNDALRTPPVFQESPVRILKPEHSWSAVVRGAALGIFISSRRARLHYGMKYSSFFTHGKDPITNLVRCKFTGMNLCRDRVVWYIEKGQEVSEKDPISFSFVRRVALNSNLIFTNYLYSSDEQDAPKYLNVAGVAAPKKLCTLVSDMSTVPKELFNEVTQEGRDPHYIISFNVVMTMMSAMLVFHLEYQGKRYGNVSAKFESA